ncbi:MAG: F0F1 ATP synthase subunit delta [Bacteroidales bacterium]|nr:F0F1 ATP synthase subunit delta [Bacteroidales bacterium]MCD8387261.1 F0F1 ATP synthase subunit delta [Bacteroidales bacterium]
MDQGLIPRRYAKALYEVAVEHGTQLKLYDKMRLIAEACAAEPKLNETLNNPFVSDADKAQLILTAAQADSSDKDIDSFIGLLEANHRLGLVRDIAVAYADIYRKANKIYRVEVVAAAPMSQAEQDRLKKLIQSHLDGGTMEYTFRVDPDLIGGFVVNIENQRLDASVKNELKQLRLKLLSNK